jgi:3-dehydroquinate synthase class II
MRTFCEMADEVNLNGAKLAQIRDEKLVEGEDWVMQNNECLFTMVGAEKVRIAVAIPLAVPRKLKVKVLKRAPNPHWVYAKKDDDFRKILVAVRPSWCDRLVGKFINVDVIEDANGGITYRHEALGK